MPAAPVAPPAPAAPSPAQTAPMPAPKTVSATPASVAAKQGVSMDNMMSGLDALAKGDANKPVGRRDQRSAPKQEPKPEPEEIEQPAEAKLNKGDDEKPETTPEPTEQPEAEQPETEPEGTEKVAAGKEGKKQNPWKLVNTYKSENATLKTKVAELEKRISDSAPREDLNPKLEAANKRLSELENEIRFVDYQKSEEFKTQYQQPYEEAWNRAIEGLKGIGVSTPDGESRPIDIDDIAQLASLPPDKARQEIKAKFPEDFAEVRDYIKDIRRLADSRAKALEYARTKGDERDQAVRQQMETMQRDTAQQWDQINKEIEGKFEFLKLVEGDDEHNEKLSKAREMVDATLRKNAYDPRLSKEDRAKVLKDHASLRNRAIAYSTLKLANARLTAKVAELQKAVDGFKKSEPGADSGKGKTKAPPPNGVGGMDAAMDRLAGYVT